MSVAPRGGKLNTFYTILYAENNENSARAGVVVRRARKTDRATTLQNHKQNNCAAP
jgi:hypothetical protein